MSVTLSIMLSSFIPLHKVTKAGCRAMPRCLRGHYKSTPPCCTKKHFATKMSIRNSWPALFPLTVHTAQYGLSLLASDVSGNARGHNGRFLSGKQLGVVVQWLDYLAVMQEPGVRFPTAEKVTSDVAPP